MMLFWEWRLRVFTRAKLCGAWLFPCAFASVLGVHTGLDFPLLRGGGLGVLASGVFYDFVEHGSLRVPNDAPLTRDAAEG